ncbi:MAG: heme-binding protein [Pseudomonadota bacterium]
MQRRQFLTQTSSAILGSALILPAIATTSASANTQSTHNSYEIPPYEVERRDGDFEIRRYAPHVLATVTLEGGRSGTIQRGFRELAGYIFGGNARSEKISMTAPVSQTPTPSNDGQSWQVAFMMPGRYDLADLPKAKSNNIRFSKTKPERQAVVQFSGGWGQNKLQKQNDRLSKWMATQGLRASSAPRYYFYDDPFTLPWKRRNEVARVLAS